MSKDYLYPKVGPGIRDPLSKGTQNSEHGRIVNTPRYSGLGGLSGPNPSGAFSGNSMKIRKPGGEK